MLSPVQVWSGPLCYDYVNGHLCKHLHRIHSLQSDKTDCEEAMDVSSANDDITVANDYEAIYEEEVKKNPYHLPSIKCLKQLVSNVMWIWIIDYIHCLGLFPSV